MSDTVNGAAEVLGITNEKITIGGVELTLRPLTGKQQVALAEEQFTCQHAANVAEFHASAMRGGYEGTRDEFAELIEGDDMIRLEEAMKKLHPLLYARAAQRMGIAPAQEK